MREGRRTRIMDIKYQQPIDDSHLSNLYGEESYTNLLTHVDKYNVISIIYIFFIILFAYLSMKFFMKIVRGDRMQKRVPKKKSQ